MKERSEGRNEWRREWEEGKRRDWRFVRLEKTPTPKSLSPLNLKLLEMGNDERQSQSINSKSINQSTNREVKTDPLLDDKP